MGLAFTKLFARLFSKKEMRILMVRKEEGEERAAPVREHEKRAVRVLRRLPRRHHPGDLRIPPPPARRGTVTPYRWRRRRTPGRRNGCAAAVTQLQNERAIARARRSFGRAPGSPTRCSSADPARAGDAASPARSAGWVAGRAAARGERHPRAARALLLLSSLLRARCSTSPSSPLPTQVGLDAAGKTTILYKLKLGEIVTTIPTIGA